MKIVLNNEERKSFEGFVIEYLISCKSALEGVGSDDALDMLKQIEGKNDAEILAELVKDCGIDRVVEIVKETQIETTYSVSAEILIAYNQYMSTSMRVLRPYTDRLVSIIHTNKDELNALSKKMPKFKLSVVNNILKGLFSMVGLEGMYVELFDLVTKFNTDEEGIVAMKRLQRQLSDRVQSSMIMTDYLNNEPSYTYKNEVCASCGCDVRHTIDTDGKTIDTTDCKCLCVCGCDDPDECTCF